jgi:hypothetical protein
MGVRIEQATSGASAATTSPQPRTWTLGGTLTETLTGADRWRRSRVLADGNGDHRRRRALDVASNRYAVQSLHEIKASGYIDRRVSPGLRRTDRRIPGHDSRCSRPSRSACFARSFATTWMNQSFAISADGRRPKLPINAFNPRTGRVFHSAARRPYGPDSTRSAAGHRWALSSGLIGWLGPRPEQADFIQVDIVYEPRENYCGKG